LLKNGAVKAKYFYLKTYKSIFCGDFIVFLHHFLTLNFLWEKGVRVAKIGHDVQMEKFHIFALPLFFP
jgi:hypothetical protein